MTDLDELVRTLLYEGYALYPYTPGTTKNATPTPFGIVYPPAYAAHSPATTFDRLRLQVVAEHGAHATLRARILFLEPAGERHQGVERRIELGPLAPGGEPAAAPFAFGAVRGRVRMSAEPLGDGLSRISVCVHNETPVAAGLDRPAALRASLLSTHVVGRIAGGRFLSSIDPPEHAAAAVMTSHSVNTFPVLASDADDAVLGAAIMLPDHPQIAPESRGDLFDATEIEEALLLHVIALSDGERDALAAQDPAVRAMLERAVSATPDDIRRLHGRVTLREPGAPAPAQVPGEEQVVAGGVTYRRGEHVRLRPAHGSNGHDALHEGRIATIERIYVDYEDGVHLAVTVDDDPGRELMRDIGRYLYFKPAEVEVIG
jgi:hypothetical protein